MPFPQKYDTATREAATARVLERRATNPKDRSVLRVVADEFNVGQQSLRTWVAAAEASQRTPAVRKSRLKFSPVVTTTISAQPAAAPDEADSALATSISDDDGRQPHSATTITRLQSEIEMLRRGNDAIKAAMRVLLGMEWARLWSWTHGVPVAPGVLESPDRGREEFATRSFRRRTCESLRNGPQQSHRSTEPAATSLLRTDFLEDA